VLAMNEKPSSWLWAVPAGTPDDPRHPPRRTHDYAGAGCPIRSCPALAAGTGYRLWSHRATWLRWRVN
jgi:hypothetical protein